MIVGGRGSLYRFIQTFPERCGQVADEWLRQDRWWIDWQYDRFLSAVGQSIPFKLRLIENSILPLGADISYCSAITPGSIVQTGAEICVPNFSEYLCLG